MRCMTNEEMLQELLHECYEIGIIEEVRRTVNSIQKCSSWSTYDVYYAAYEKVINNLGQSETNHRSII
jgi:hypothetical protein